MPNTDPTGNSGAAATTWLRRAVASRRVRGAAILLAVALLAAVGWWLTDPASEPTVTARYTEETTFQASPAAEVYAGTRYCVEYRSGFRTATLCRDYFRSAAPDAKTAELFSPTATCWTASKVGGRLPDCWQLTESTR